MNELLDATLFSEIVNLNLVLKNKWVQIFLILFLMLCFFFAFYFIYNLRKIAPNPKYYFKRLLMFSLSFLFFIVSFKLLVQYSINHDLNISLFLNIILRFIYLILIILFSIYFVPFIFILPELVANKGKFIGSSYDNPIKMKFRDAQYELERMIEKLDKDEFVFKTKLFDIYSVVDYYNGGIKEFKKYFGNAINFDKFNYIKLNNTENINEILDKLSFSIPYYIFYGKLEQLKELDMHLKNIINFLDKEYSIAGSQFINEIIEMNNKIKQYLGDNYFELQPIDKIYTNKNRNYKKISFFLMSIMISIITAIIQNGR